MPKTSTHVGIPQKNRGIVRNAIGLFLPAIESIGVYFKTPNKQKGQSTLVALSPVMSWRCRIDIADLIEIAKICIQLKRISIRHIFI